MVRLVVNKFVFLNSFHLHFNSSMVRLVAGPQWQHRPDP
ncbi:hypothetical protein NC99_30430 [Sunxiuqinia dokdonensis]|uniref:Uncharacterized protein n=1 Tax=Sunxiuqinia dokdonensis TaxID=1409788 RepID=A0A0L8V6D7_9BACT|nr:hypothetical protein NC99_30430 [Sunxiuqinia dokdonensis]